MTVPNLLGRVCADEGETSFLPQQFASLCSVIPKLKAALPSRLRLYPKLQRLSRWVVATPSAPSRVRVYAVDLSQEEAKLSAIESRLREPAERGDRLGLFSEFLASEAWGRISPAWLAEVVGVHPLRAGRPVDLLVSRGNVDAIAKLLQIDELVPLVVVAGEAHLRDLGRFRLRAPAP